MAIKYGNDRFKEELRKTLVPKHYTICIAKVSMRSVKQPFFHLSTITALQNESLHIPVSLDKAVMFATRFTCEKMIGWKKEVDSNERLLFR